MMEDNIRKGVHIYVCDWVTLRQKLAQHHKSTIIFLIVCLWIGKLALLLLNKKLLPKELLTFATIENILEFPSCLSG